MEHKHNADFTTKWELINPDGKIVKKGGDFSEPNCEGKVSYRILNKRKELVYEHEQPMQSFTVGFLKAFVDGYRLAKRNETFSVLPNMIGHCRTDSKVYVQNISLIAPFNTYSISAWTISAISSTSSGFVLDSMSVESDCIRVVFHIERSITSGSGSITEVGLYATNMPVVNNSDDYKEGMIARDVFTSGYSFGVGSFVKITWTLDFPKITNKTITMNWIKNFFQNIADSNYNDFIQIDGTTTANGVSNITGQTFTKEVNCRGGANDNTKGIVIGTSNISTNPNQFDLGSRIANGTGSGEMEYGTMTQSSDIAMIYPTEGKADVSYSRTFKNNSGNSVIIKEAGMIAKTSSTSEGIDTAGSYLIARWLTGDIVVPNGYTLKIYFQPQVTATPEDHSNIDESQIILVTDEMRQLHPSLRCISMIQKNARNSAWVEAKQYASNLSLGGFSDWRLPLQTTYSDPQASNDIPQNELRWIQKRYHQASDKLVGWNDSVISDSQVSSSEVTYIGTYSGYYVSRWDKRTAGGAIFCVR
jgi:hypothetical protein